ncbi:MULTISPECIES: FAD-dependent monooxygenase [Methylobacterium]|jgi:2-octaprenyl-6-methoxyphenol hydroxylase|uniref:FAD-dependent monooxygenase n=2 Tax=Methylobacteriaceae TaxID=119045 RepID=UPI000B808FB0|nr:MULTISPECIES: FAD-dependent monooxygenase [Methylobacterium]MBK3397400.1 FAD-dependent monooxygenase [Methylobacterium ajmalii]MBK3412301.1 FAD-dependent monooxygenase [Methylobacterium ajmalii]MBZ6415238.1 FAD-dependent monooxygenase [Methylobacterium sp.]
MAQGEGVSGRRAAAREIVVAGGGLPGLALALALRQTLGEAVRITVCDPAFGRADAPRDLRAYAVAAAARRMLARLGVWDAVSASAQPIREMVITDSRLADPVRPTFLTFEGEVAEGEPFAHMVEGGGLLAALRDAAVAAGVVLEASPVQAAVPEADRIVARLPDGRALRADLVVAADGARSRLREAAGIGWVGWSYPQSGIVATVAHERDHEGRAIEHFLPSGPFAVLPLPPGGSLGHRSSIVWTERQADVPALLGGGPEEALMEVERRFGLALGRIALESPLKAYPLAFGIARRFGARRLLLLGDAAHVIHPIAGQGLNLGLRSAAALAESLADTMRLGLDPGGPEALEAYERSRRFDTLAMGAATDGLNRLFSTDALPVRLARDLGLGLVDRMPGLKRLFIREAAGLRGRQPRLMRGEAL